MERKNTSWLQIPSHLKSPFAIFGMVFQLSFITVEKAGLGAFLSVLGRAVNIVLAGFSWAFFSGGYPGWPLLPESAMRYPSWSGSSGSP